MPMPTRPLPRVTVHPSANVAYLCIQELLQGYERAQGRTSQAVRAVRTREFGYEPLTLACYGRTEAG